MRQVSSKMRRISKGVAALTAVGVIAASCGGGGSSDEGSTDTSAPPSSAPTSEGAAVQGGNLTIAVESETPGWNPASTQWALEGNFVGSSFFEPLMVLNSDGVAVPWIAESVEPNENSTLWTITVRDGITFQDGTEVTAENVADSFRFQVSEGLIAVISATLIGDIAVTGPDTFTIAVHAQWGAFDTMLSTALGYVMAPSMLAKEDKGASAPVGTGAYQFERWDKDSALRVRAYGDYWGGPCAVVEDPDAELQRLCDDLGVPLGQKNGPWLDSMEFRPIPDSVKRQQALESGDVDLILNTRPGITANLRANYQVVTDYSSEQTFVQLSTSKAPFDNKHARRALAYATDRVALVEALGAGEDIPVDTSPFEEDDVWGGLAPDQTNYPLYDPGKAAEELEFYLQDMADKGTPVDKLSFTLIGIATLDDLEVMQALSAMWAKAGIEAKIESVKKEAVVSLQIGGQFQAVLSRNYSFSDPDQNYVFWSDDFVEEPLIVNFNQWYTETSQASLDLGRESRDPEFRKKAYDEFVKERNDNAVDIWLFNVPWALIGENEVRGLNAFRNLGIAGYEAKPWVAGLWIDPTA